MTSYVIHQVQNPFSHMTSLACDHYNPQTLPEHITTPHMTSLVTSLGQDLSRLSSTPNNPIYSEISATPYMTESGGHFASWTWVPPQSSNFRWPTIAITQSWVSTQSGQTLDQFPEQYSLSNAIPPSDRCQLSDGNVRDYVSQSTDQIHGSVPNDREGVQTSNSLSELGRINLC